MECHEQARVQIPKQNSSVVRLEVQNKLLYAVMKDGSMAIYPINENTISESNMTVFRPFKEVSGEDEIGLTVLQNLILVQNPLDPKSLLLFENNFNHEPEDLSTPLLHLLLDWPYLRYVMFIFVFGSVLLWQYYKSGDKKTVAKTIGKQPVGTAARNG